jgi:LPS sulfotransferase NodH
LLESAGIGRPDEYLNPTGHVCGEPAWRSILGLPVDEYDGRQYLAELIKLRSAGGCFGVKMSRAELVDFMLEHHPATKLIWLYREDTLGQAVSLYRAKHTGAFRHWQQQRQGAVEFDPAAILECQREIVNANRRWGRYFARRDEPVCSLSYEGLCEYPRSRLTQIAMSLGLPSVPNDDISTRCKIQRDQITDDWVDRIRSETDA